MDEALAAAERVLAVLSPAYLRSEYARDEWTAALVRGREQADRLLPVRVEACELPPLLANLIHLDLAGLDEPTAARRLLAAVDPGRARPAGKLPFPGSGGRAQDAPAQFPGRRPRIFHVPPRNPNFTGRKKLLTRLRRDLSGRKAVTVVHAKALHGLGGVGKTQLALEYAHRHAADYDLIWWVTVDQPPTIPSQLVALANRLGIPGPIGQAETVAALLDELRHHGRWLLVFDNVEDPHDLRPYWPSTGGGHVLVTSRNPAWTGLATTFPLEVLSRSDAVAFLQRRAGLDRQAADALAEALGDLPLALEQAAAYLDQTGTPPQEYLGLLRERGPELFALGRPVTSEQTIATTWTVSLDRIRTESPIARDLLCMCAFLGSGDLPRVLLTEHPEVLPEQLAVALRDQVAFQQALGAIRRYSLATVTTETINVHRLVQAVVRHQLDHDQAQEWAAAALRLVRAAFPSDHTDRKAWPRYARLLPHVLAVTQQAQALGIEPELAASLLNQTAVYLRARAVYQQAQGLNERALALREAHLGPNHPDTATSLSNLALVLRDQGDLDAARTLHERALAIRDVELGPDHPDTVRSLNNLAHVLTDQGDLDGARTLHERALAIREANLGPDHPDTARALNNLAVVLHLQGDLDGARARFERALAIREAYLGASDPDTALTLNNLALVLRDQGDLMYAQGDVVGARSLYGRVLAIRTAHLGPDHPETVRSQWNLALVMAERFRRR